MLDISLRVRYNPRYYPGRIFMTLAPHRPMTSPSDQSELDAPPIPAGLVAILLLTAIALAVIFVVAAQIVQTP